MDKQFKKYCNGTDSVSTIILSYNVTQHYFEKYDTRISAAVSTYHFPLPEIIMSKLKYDLLTPFNF